MEPKKSKLSILDLISQYLDQPCQTWEEFAQVYGQMDIKGHLDDRVRDKIIVAIIRYLMENE